MSSARPKCALFMRGSQDSLNNQFAVLAAYAEQQAMDIATGFISIGAATGDDCSVLPALEEAIKDPSRPWNFLLMADFSRISRSSMDCWFFLHSCEKAGVKVLLAKYPILATAPDYPHDFLTTIIMHLTPLLTEDNIGNQTIAET